SVASRPVKPEMAEPAIGPRIPVLVEIPLDQARTAFREEVAQECDLTGDMVAWSSRLAEDAGLIVHHRMVYDPANDNEFPLRDPEDALHRVDRRYAGEDGKCHPNVKLKAIRMSRVGLDFLKALPARDPRVRMSDEEVGVVIGKLVADARDEFERLIEGRAASRPRCHARRLEAADLADHEGAPKAQFGVFVRRPADPALYPTLSNGRILGFYMGALLRSEEERQRAWERHPGGEQYSIDADRASRRRGFGWSKGTRRTRVTFAGLGAANSVVFANTALRAPDPADPIPAYDRSRLNAIYLPFDLQLTDKSGRMQSEVAVALLALDNLFPEGDGRQELQVYADYGDAYLVNFTQQGLASEVEEVKEEAGVEVGAIVSNPGASGSAEDGSADESSRSCPPSV
ncbi:MAG TPA: hypothetical protein VFP68_22050, partial [Burkholderiaceae bacterium]|nr:hypothetical protein [Burkholderiaceae bacterium]